MSYTRTLYSDDYTYEEYLAGLREEYDAMTAAEREELHHKVEAIEAEREAERQASLNSDLPF